MRILNSDLNVRKTKIKLIVTFLHKWVGGVYLGGVGLDSLPCTLTHRSLVKQAGWLDFSSYTHIEFRERVFNLQKYFCTNGPSLHKILMEFFSLSILQYTICYLNVSRSSEVHHVISTTESAVERPA